MARRVVICGAGFIGITMLIHPREQNQLTDYVPRIEHSPSAGN
jgi:hypothetical protein